LFEKYIYILASEMASAGNQRCAKCIGTLSFPASAAAAAAAALSNRRRDPMKELSSGR